QQLVAQIAALTNADVAASDDVTGHWSLQGDWELEYAVGEIEHAVLVSAETQEGWVGALNAQFYINIQGGNSSQSISSTTSVGQSFSYINGESPDKINQISVQLKKDVDAANQTISVQLLSGG